MRTFIKSAAAMAIVATLAACAAEPEPEVVIVDPIPAEPVSGKF